MKGMILAAGLGSRLKPWTDEHPKALAVVNGKSLLQRNVEYLQSHGITEVIVNVHHFADQIISAIADSQGWGSVITISDETDEVLETGGGLNKAAWYLNSDPFVLLNADILTDLDLGKMIAAQQALKPLATLATRKRDTSRYFLFNSSGTLCGWQNVKTGEEKMSRACSDCHPQAFSGMHVISPDIFPLISMEGKFSMVDLYLALAGEQEIKSFHDNSARFIDVGKPESLGEATVLFT